MGQEHSSQRRRGPLHSEEALQHVDGAASMADAPVTLPPIILASRPPMKDGYVDVIRTVTPPTPPPPLHPSTAISPDPLAASTAATAAPDDTELPPIVQIHRAPAPRKGVVPQASLHPHGPMLSPLPPPPQPHPPTTQTAPKTFNDEEIKAILSIDPDRVIVVIRNNVYDVTSFLDLHPGGPSVLRRNNGKDITEAFFSLHNPKTAERLPEFLMGKFVKAQPVVAAPAAASPPASALTMEGIRHSLQQDANRLVLILFGDAYDITPMRNTHPGGLRVLLNYNGKECGDIFMRIHGLRAKKQVHAYFMGRVLEAGDAPSPLQRYAEAPNPSAKPTKPANPRVQSTRILEKELVNAAGSLQYVTFSSPKPLRLTPGGHVKLYSNVERDEWRYYTPFQTDVASFKVCIKRYPNGRTSDYVLDQPEGGEVFFEGPFAPSWEVQLDAYVRKETAERRHVLLLTGGTGITPMYAIAADALAKQTTSVTLVCSVHTPDDVMLIDEINQLLARYARALPDQPHTLRVALAFSGVSTEESQLESPLTPIALMRCGAHVDVDFLKTLDLPPTQAAVLCGPPAFNDDLASSVLKAGVCPIECIHSL